MMKIREVIKKKIAYTKWRMQHVATILADVNATDRHGRTALHRACRDGDELMITILLRNGADLNVLTQDEKETPAHLAVRNGHLKALELLLYHCHVDKKLNFLNAKTKTTGSTALHFAAKMGRLDLVKCLLKNFATYVATDNSGKKPIEITNDVKIIEFFNLIDELFQLIKKFDASTLSKLRSLKRDDLLAVGNACNNRRFPLWGEITCAHLSSPSRYFCAEAFLLIKRAREIDLQEYELIMKRSNRNKG